MALTILRALLLDFAQPLGQLWQTLKPGVLLLEPRQWPRGSPPHRFSGADLLPGRNSRLRPNDTSAFYRAAVCNSHLPSVNYMVSDLTASRNSRLRRDHRVFANVYVMRYVHHIVEFHAAVNPRLPKRTPRNRRVAPNLHVFPNFHGP